MGTEVYHCEAILWFLQPRTNCICNNVPKINQTKTEYIYHHCDLELIWDKTDCALKMKKQRPAIYVSRYFTVGGLLRFISNPFLSSG